jgi:hypothetical protein
VHDNRNYENNRDRRRDNRPNYEESAAVSSSASKSKALLSRADMERIKQERLAMVKSLTSKLRAQIV